MMTGKNIKDKTLSTWKVLEKNRVSSIVLVLAGALATLAALSTYNWVIDAPKIIMALLAVASAAVASKYEGN